MEKARLSSAALLAGILLIACTCAVLLAFPAQAHAAREYGFLSSKYESGDNPASIDYCSYKQDGVKQEYGVAYGAYQMSSGNAKKFAYWLKSHKNADYQAWGKKLVKAGNADIADAQQDGKHWCGTGFDARWRAIAKASSKQFFNAQYAFCIETYYEPAVAYWEKVEPAFKVSDYGTALRAALFSTAAQHGPYGSAYYIFSNVSFKAGMSEKKLIKAIYEERARATTVKPTSSANKIASTATSKKYGINGKYLVHFYSSSSAAQISIYRRLWINEKADALAYCPHSKLTGGTVSYAPLNDKQVKKKVTATKCKSCGALIKAASSSKVALVCSYSGKKMRDQSGTAVTVHVKGHYKVVATSLYLRKKARGSAKSLAVLGKGAIVRVRASVMGSDGYWWGEVKHDGKTGYLRMSYLSHLGTASAHSFKKGMCTWCKASRKQAGYVKAGTYETVLALKVRKAAYTAAVKKGSLKKGAKVKIVKVCSNALHDRWGKLSTGGYVKMSWLRK